MLRRSQASQTEPDDYQTSSSGLCPNCSADIAGKFSLFCISPAHFVNYTQASTIVDNQRGTARRTLSITMRGLGSDSTPSKL